jgi:hypothetical protein
MRVAPTFSDRVLLRGDGLWGRLTSLKVFEPLQASITKVSVRNFGRWRYHVFP